MKKPRSKFPKKKSRKNFTKNAVKVHPKNNKSTFRGGYRL